MVPGLIALGLANSGRLELTTADQALTVLVGTVLPVGLRGLVAAMNNPIPAGQPVMPVFPIFPPSAGGTRSFRTPQRTKSLTPLRFED